MRFLFLILFIFHFSCQSVEEYNAKLEQNIPVNQCYKDIDLAYFKLKKMHPRLYWYISKDKLENRLDSLKQSIKTPISRFDLYSKIAHFTNTIGQGHLTLIPSLKKYSKKELKKRKSLGKGPFSQLELEILNNKLFLIKDNSRNKIKEILEIEAINNENIQELLNKYKSLFSSDGYNKTFYNQWLSKNFGTYFVYEYGIQDSIFLKFKNKNDIIKVKRDTFEIEKLKPKITKDSIKSLNRFHSKYGFNKESKIYHRQFKVLDSIEKTALMTIKSFTIGDYSSFYESCFQEIKEKNIENLIIDLRNNPGGRLIEIDHLYSYLAKEPYIFIDNYEVVSKTSMLKNNFFKGGTVITKIIRGIIAPFYYTFSYFNVSKQNDRYIYNTRFSKLKSPNSLQFSGKVFVLINGGSFSASSIIASNLKGSKRAYFVGEETGGAYNGTVAAQLPIVKLPYSKINIRMGLAVVSPYYKSDIEGRGVFPDTEIIPTLDDRIKNIDPELKWVIEDIKREKEAEELLIKNMN